MEDHAVDLNLRECLGAFKQLSRVEVFGGNNVEDFDGEHLRNMMDTTTGRYGTIKVQVKRASKVRDILKSKKCVLVYERNLGDPSTTHCVYIKDTIVSEKGELSCLCINSWGIYDPTPLVDLKRTKHIVYCIDVQWIPVGPRNKELSILKEVKALSDNSYVKSVILIGIGIFGKVVNLVLV